MPDELEIRVPDVLRHRRQDVVPDRCEGASELLHASRAGHEPDVAVLAAFTPPADMNVADARHREQGALHLQQERPELRGAFVVEIGEVDVLARLEQHDGGEPARLVEGPDRPVFVRPEQPLLAVRAPPAIDAADAVPRPLGLDRRRELTDSELAVERP